MIPEREFTSAAGLGFARSGAAYEDFAAAAANTARTKTILATPKLTPTWLASSSERVYAVAGDGELIFSYTANKLCKNVSGIYAAGDVLADIVAGTNMTGGDEFADFYTANDIIESAWVGLDGAYFFSTGQETAATVGHLFRSADAGATWTHVLAMTNGFVPFWAGGMSGTMRGLEMVIPEYGLAQQADQPRRVYYSADSGATWAAIYVAANVLDLSAGAWAYPDGQHVHYAVFSSLSTDVIYFFLDNDAPLGFRKLAYAAGAGGKPAAVNWTVSIITQGVKSVSCLQVGSRMFFGNDGARELSESTITEFDPATDSFIASALRLRKGSSAGTSAASFPNVAAGSPYCFQIYEHAGVYYACLWGSLSTSGPTRQSGIWVSDDLENWTCAWLVQQSDADLPGASHIAGYAGGYIWGFGYDVTHSNKLFKFAPIVPQLRTFVRAERAVTNVIGNTNDSQIEATVGNWTRAGNTAALARVTGQAPPVGTACLTLQASNLDSGVGGTAYAISGQLGTHFGYTASVGDYLVGTVWLKAAPGYPTNLKLGVWFQNSDGLVQGSLSYFIPAPYWQQIRIYAKCTGAAVASTMLSVRFKNAVDGGDAYDIDARPDRLNTVFPGAGADYSAAVVYVTGLQVTHTTDVHAAFNYMPGGHATAAENLIAPLAGLAAAHSLSFEWRPEVDSREWHADCPIATIHGHDGSYLYLFWDQSAGEFSLTDGTRTETTSTSGTCTWESADFLRFAIVSNGTQAKLAVESSRLPQTVLVGANVATLTGVPTHVQFAADSDRSLYGLGLFGNIRTWAAALSDAQVTDAVAVGDLLETALHAELTGILDTYSLDKAGAFIAHKSTFNLTTGVMTIFESDGTTPSFTLTRATAGNVETVTPGT